MRTLLLLITFLLFIPTTAAAEDLYLNGLRLSGTELSGQVLRGVQEVAFDDDGNIHIIAPQHAIELPPEVARERRNEAAMRRLLGGSFFVVVQSGGGEDLPVAVTIEVNGEEVAALRSSERPFVQEVTELLRLGENTLTVRTRPEAGVHSDQPGTVQVVMGEGTRLESGAVRIDRRMVSMTQPASELRREREQDRSVTLEYRSSDGR